MRWQRRRPLPLLRLLLHVGAALAQSAGGGLVPTSGWEWWLGLGAGGGGGGAGVDEPTSRVHMDAAMETWDEQEGADPECEFWNGTFQWELGLCSHFAVSRLGPRHQDEALRRAVRCAARAATDCVLGPEVGVGFPALFVYDADAGMRMLLAPRLLPPDPSDAAQLATGAVRVHDPMGRGASRVLQLRRALQVEFLTTGSKQLQTELLRDADAYCVQLARHAISSACWRALD